MRPGQQDNSLRQFMQLDQQFIYDQTAMLLVEANCKELHSAHLTDKQVEQERLRALLQTCDGF
jgi:hypothetical protein